MANFQGFYINLDRDKERERNLKIQLKKVGKLEKYKRFKATEGNSETAGSKGLKIGEDGIWRSWITLLDTIDSDSDKSYDYVHIVEDDVVLSKQLYSLFDQLKEDNSEIDILMTDMYTNPSIYRAFEKIARNGLIETSKCTIQTTREYTGCAASCIIHKSKIDTIKRALKEEYENSKLIPIDNYLRKMSKKGKLNILTTIPFLTSVDLASISKSTIQDRKKNETVITRTQIYNTYLRRMLSVFRETTNIHDIVNIAEEMLDVELDQKDRFNTQLIRTINSFLESENVLRYRQDPRLNTKTDEDV
tara:strand:- start:166 stop:1077 length:912 start_codon:yes stop_codon:yes gene_type:complete